MKKIAFLIVMLCSVLISSCSNNMGEYVKNQISEERVNCYEGSVEHISATLMCGVREKNYIVNGYSSELIQFGVITVKFDEDTDSSVFYKLNVDADKQFDGTMERNPYDGSYVADIACIIRTNLVELQLKWGSVTKTLQLSNVSDQWQIDSTKALSIAVNACSKDLKKMCSNGSFMGEAYVKIRSNSLGQEPQYLWYICFVGINGDRISAFVSTLDGKVLYQKVD